MADIAIDEGTAFEWGDGTKLWVENVWVDEDCDAQIEMSDGNTVTPDDIHGLLEDAVLFPLE